MTPEEERDIDGQIAESVFGWRRWKYKGLSRPQSIEHGMVCLQPPDWEIEPAFTSVFTSTEGSVTHHPVTPHYTTDWNETQRVVRLIGQSNVAWSIFRQKLALQLNRRLGVSGTSREARIDDVWRQVEPLDVCRAALEMARALPGWGKP